MNSRKIGKKIKMGLMAALMLPMAVATPTFATTQHEYVPIDGNGRPAIYISLVDIVNDQLEFTLDTSRLSEQEISKIEVGMVTKREVLDEGILSFEGAVNSWSEKYFITSESLSYYLSGESGVYRTYVFDLIPAMLLSNPYKDLFYVIDLANGTKLNGYATFYRCGIYRNGNESCKADEFDSMMPYDNITYVATPAPEKYVRSSNSGASGSSGDASSGDAGTLGGGETGESKSSEGNTNSDNVEVINTAEVKTSEDAPKTIAKVATAVKTTDTDTSDDIDDDEEYDDIEAEGYGETTLDVPKLGKEVEDDVFKWLPYFATGVALGGISVWFLSLIIRKVHSKMGE